MELKNKYLINLFNYLKKYSIMKKKKARENHETTQIIRKWYPLCV